MNSSYTCAMLLHHRLNNTPNVKHHIVTSPLPNNTRTHRPPILSKPNRDTHRRQPSQGCRHREHILHVRTQVALDSLLRVEQWCGLDGGGVQENVDTPICVEGGGVGCEDVARAEDAVEVCTNDVADALRLEEVVVEGTVEYIRARNTLMPMIAYSALRAYAPSRIRLWTSGPKPFERV